ncbi:MAG: transcription elongation factor GreA [Anaerovoracaceae bacterium]|nr:transcription elongation factor GreA [Bacillota bacterium]MDY3954899.1 transcription elongation factor GreA [Anaerovoracaceae bacterium]
MAEATILTKEGYDKLVAEHEELVSVRRKEVAERLKEAISYGDLSENAEYDSAKNEQAELEERIALVEQMLRNVQIIDHDTVDHDRVQVGVRVKLKDADCGDTFEYEIVGSTEADPFEGRISNESQVGKQLLGHMVGDVVEIEVPDGILHYEILQIGK